MLPMRLLIAVAIFVLYEVDAGTTPPTLTTDSGSGDETDSTTPLATTPEPATGESTPETTDEPGNSSPTSGASTEASPTPDPCPAGQSCEYEGQEFPVYAGLVVSWGEDSCGVIVCNVNRAWEFFHFSNQFVCENYESQDLSSGVTCNQGDLSLPVGSFLPTTQSIPNTCQLTICGPDGNFVPVDYECSASSEETPSQCVYDGNASPPCTELEVRATSRRVCNEDGFLIVIPLDDPDWDQCQYDPERRLQKQLFVGGLPPTSLEDYTNGCIVGQEICQDEGQGQANGQENEQGNGQGNGQGNRQGNGRGRGKGGKTEDRRRRGRWNVGIYCEGRECPDGSVGVECGIRVSTDECLARDSMVQLENGTRTRLEDLKIGDFVMAADEEGRRIVSSVIGFIDNWTSRPVLFYRVITDAGRQIHLTPNHLIFVADSEANRTRILLAKEVRLGDRLVTAGDGTGTVGRVVDIGLVQKRGALSVLTEAGNLYVDDVLVSCYSNADPYFIPSLHRFLFVPMVKLWTTLGLPGSMAAREREGYHPVFWVARLVAENTPGLKKLIHKALVTSPQALDLNIDGFYVSVLKAHEMFYSLF